MRESAVAVRGIVKTFGGAPALRGIDLEVRSGECHAVVGENGAGKSTLMKILSGIEKPDAGSVTCFGLSLESGPRFSLAAGIALVHQERSLVPDLSVAENIMLGAHTPTRIGLIDRKKMRDAAKRQLQRIGAEIPTGSLVRDLSSAEQQFVEIAKALMQEPRVLILDEPSASMTPQETDRLLALVRELIRDGIAVIYVSHRIPEIFAICGRATVLRDGASVGTYEIGDISSDQLVELMVGREIVYDNHVARQRNFGPVLLEVQDLSAAGVDDVSFSLRAGEILGLGGLVGAGRTEIARTILGLRAKTTGSVTIRREGRVTRLNSYAEALKAGVAYVPEERRDEGVVLGMSIEDNLSIPTRAKTSRFGVGNRTQRRQQAERTIAELRVRSQGRGQLVSRLSGGNQQKVAFGKWVLAQPDLLILDEPTRGVDVGAKSEIHDLIRREADRGAGVIVISSDMPELLSVSDRILVIRGGGVAGELDATEATESSVIRLAVGH